VPLAALRLVNPPKRRRKAAPKRKSTARAGAVRVVKTPTGTRYMKKVGTRWQFTSAKKVAAARKRKRTLKAKANPPARKAAPKRRAAPKKRAAPKRRRPVARKAAPKRRRTVARKAAPKRKVTKRKVTKRAATTRPKARRNPVAKARRRAAPRRKVRRGPTKATARRKMKALWAKARRQGKKTIKGVRLGAGPKRRKRRAAPKRRRVVLKRRAAPKRRTTRRVRRNPWNVRKTKKRTVTLRHSRRPKRKYRLVATRKKRYSPRLVRKNPMGTIKKVLPIYGGVLAVRVLGGLFRQYVAPRLGALPGGVAAVLPAGVMFLFSTMLAPKIGFIRKSPKLAEGMKLGSTFALFDAIVRNFIVPAIPATNPTLATIAGSLAGYDDTGVMGYGSYIADPTGYSLPGRGPTAEPGVGLDVHEAMAMDEYIADDGMGFDVTEALAGTEIDYMQRGGAGGTLSHTVFTD